MPSPSKPTLLRLGVSQSHTLSSTTLTLRALARTAQRAASSHIDLLLFPEAYLGGYPRTATFGSAVGSRADSGREQFRRYFNSAVDLGDTPAGAGDKWVARRLERPRDGGERGDGTREELERVARETKVFLVVGCVERAGGTLYCSVVYVCPREGCLGKRRKVMPTGQERLIWGQGQPSTLRAITTTIRGVRLTLAAAICWENYMPLLRQSLYAQNVNLYLAPTADARETWEPLMRTIAMEGRCVVLSANQCVRQADLPGWIRGEEEEEVEESEVVGELQRAQSYSQSRSSMTGRRRVSIIEDGNEIVLPVCKEEGEREEGEQNGHAHAHEEEMPGGKRRVSIIDAGNEIVLPSPKTKEANGHFPFREEERDGDGVTQPTTTKTTSPSSSSPFVSRGGSCIVSPSGAVLAGPLWEDDDGLLSVDVDMEDCVRGRLDLDVAGHYSRSDAFRLEVEGLDLSPPV